MMPMYSWRMTAVKFMFFSLLMSLVLPGGLMAQADDGDARAIPQSKDRIRGSLTTPDGGKFKFDVRDGGMIRIRDDSTGETIGLLATFGEDPGQKDKVTLVEFRITDHPSGAGESLTWSGQEYPIDLAEKREEVTQGGFVVNFTKVIEAPEPAARKSLDLFELPPDYSGSSTCCISCGSYTVCACSVSASCGSCCAGACCGGGGNPGPFHDY